MKVEPMSIPENPELTIQILESTIDELRAENSHLSALLDRAKVLALKSIAGTQIDELCIQWLKDVESLKTPPEKPNE